MHVLDTAAFTVEEEYASVRVATIPAVRDTLSDESGARFDALAGSGMHLHVPNRETVASVRRAAQNTGQETAVSAVDLQLIATAFELDATIVTANPALKPLATAFQLSVDLVDKVDPPAASRSFHCQACYTEFEMDHDQCPVYGSDRFQQHLEQE